jgi:N-acetylglucosamine kinase-like BadF-type ATPase
VAYYLGIDGGGSKTTCVVGDQAALLATFTAGPSNITRVGETRAREALLQGIQGACAIAGIGPGQVGRACIGIAGAGRDAVVKAVRAIVAEIVSGEIDVTGDMQIALAAAFGTGPGVVVIAGTGSVAYGRDERGRTARAGGWGFAVSDEGSAHWIGRTAVGALLRVIDQRINSGKTAEAVADTLPLFTEVKAAWNVDSLDDVATTANSTPDFAALFPAVLNAAGAGDILAQQVLAQAGGELGQLAAIVVRRLFAEPAYSQTVIPLAMVGGVFRHSSRVRDTFANETRKLDSRLALNPEVVEPVAGALQIARTAASPSESKSTISARR